MVNAVIYGMVLSMLISIPPLMEVAYTDFSLLSVSEQIEAFFGNYPTTIDSVYYYLDN